MTDYPINVIYLCMLLILFYVMIPPQVMRGVYLSPGVLSAGKGERALKRMIERGIINTVVVDLKDVRGTKYIKLCRKKIKMYKRLGVYTIGRIPVFKDKYLALRDSGRLSLKTPAGGIWRDPVEGYWTDPENKEVWEYNIKLAKKGFEIGCDEIQFDYIRYPSSHIPYRRKRNKTEVLCSFLEYAMRELRNIGWVGIDFYGFVCWRDTIPLEGQSIRDMGMLVDAVYPMLYPSHFGNGFLLDGSREERTYNIILYSLVNARFVLPSPLKRVVAYIQAFDWKKSTMGKKYIKNQVKAAMDAVGYGCNGFILWEAGGDYYQAYREIMEYIREEKKNGNHPFALGHALSPSG